MAPAPSFQVLGPAEIASGDGIVSAQNMRAIIIPNEVVVNHPQGEIRIPPGTIGYFIKDSPVNQDDVFLQLIHHGKRGTITIPRIHVRFGAFHHEFHIDIPSVRFQRVAFSLGHDRASSITGRAVWQMWSNIRDNLPVLRQYGLKKIDELEAILTNETKFNETVSYLIGAFTADAWDKIKEGGHIKSLMSIKPVSEDYPGLSSQQQVIYARIAINDLDTSPEHTDFGKYGGRTVGNPIDRHNQHEEHMNGRLAQSPHYQIAKKYAYRVMIPLMKIKGAPELIMAMAETTVCCLFDTWHSGVSFANGEIKDPISAGTVDHYMLVTLFRELSLKTFKDVGFPLYPGKGCNWSFPLENKGHNQRGWLRCKVTGEDGRAMLVHRTTTSIAYLRNQEKKNSPELGLRIRFTPLEEIEMSDGTMISSQLLGLSISYNLMHLKDQLSLRHGQLVIVSIEKMEDPRERHPNPWYRHSYVGAWNNSDELHSFGIRIEVMRETTKEWFSFPIQCNNLFVVYDPSKSLEHVERKDKKLMTYLVDKRVTTSWRMATHIIQLLDHRRYKLEECPVHLCPYLGARVQEVVFDHLNQKVTFKLVEEKLVDPPKAVSFHHNTVKMKQNFPEVIIGPQPPNGWFREGGRKLRSPSCLACWTNGQSLAVRENGCNSRRPVDVKDSDDPDAEYIRSSQSTCSLCWDNYRRPCAWIKPSAGHVEGKSFVIDNGPQCEGLYPKRFVQATPEAIPDPMRLEEYYAMEEDKFAHEGMTNDDDGDGDDIEDGFEAED
ncbi:uncharacterized protein CTRU02_206536 [Colletotrichum truncatum]|uniref:Uncharacterized protein n=1 Tax=Colletotrichum truncatum TaxID=5467 RepID=A0ACC3Z760_COLTU|nr:uncharacterized protein CTRU02_11907 [Colletotrichum truncatum]KAF6785282.1 hypothetical protein CTRU02_11907 [Colletotrichum truncatum]